MCIRKIATTGFLALFLGGNATAWNQNQWHRSDSDAKTFAVAKAFLKDPDFADFKRKDMEFLQGFVDSYKGTPAEYGTMNMIRELVSLFDFIQFERYAATQSWYPEYLVWKEKEIERCRKNPNC